MKPYAAVPYDSCFPSSYLTLNSIKSLCGVEYKARVEASGVIRLTPLSKSTFNYGSGYGPDMTPMPCQNLNASGLFNGMLPAVPFSPTHQADLRTPSAVHLVFTQRAL
jgi:hypothetical protein